MRPDLLQRHDVADPLAQPGVALRGAVLQRHLAAAGDQLADHLADGVERERGHVGRAAGQRDDLGPGGHGEQGPDLGGDHADGTFGVLTDIGVNSLSLRCGLLFAGHGFS